MPNSAAGYAPPPGHPYAPRRHHQGTRKRRSSADSQVFGALMLVFGTGWLLREIGAVTLSWEGLLASVLIVLGVGMVLTAHAKAGGGLVVLGIFLTLTLASTSSINIDKMSRVGDRTIRPTTVEELRPQYDLFAGDFLLDLTAVPFPDGETTVPVDMGFGKVEVIVPTGLALDVYTELGAGDLWLLGKHSDGPAIEDSHTDEGYKSATKRLRLTVDAGTGKVIVRRRAAATVSPTSAPEATDASG